MVEVSAGQWSIIDYIHRGHWWQNRGILTLNLFLIIPLLTSVANGLDSSLVNGLQILPAWKLYFNDPQGKSLGLLISAQFLGNLIGLPFTPYVSDRFGRRFALFWGGVIMLVGVALQSAAWNVPIFTGARFIVGFGLSFCQNAAPLLLIELAYPTQRGRITSMFNSCWYFGSIISAWVCYGALTHAEKSEWSWRIPTLMQAICPIIQLAIVWFMPESPRWLVSKGMESRAAQILAHYHARGSDERDPLVVFEMAQIRHAIRMEEEINRSTSYWSLFSTAGNRKRMRIILGIAVFSQWSGNGLVSYYIETVLKIVGIDSPEKQSIINGCLQVFNFVIAIGAAMLVDVAGRRPLFVISNSGMLLTFCSWTITTALYRELNNVTAARVTIPLIFLFYFFYDLAYTPMLVAYALEILPFRIRAKGFAVMNLTIMATIAFNQFVNPWALKAISWWYYIVYCGWLIFELLFIIFFIVETKGRTLEETAALFDGDEQPHDLVAMGGEAASMTMRMSRGIVLTAEHDASMQQEQEKSEYYEMKKRYRDSDITASSTDVHARAL
ncbi:lactose permease [Panaeolus cyanescens]|uniref:Lactose permease n=1 Tax=Panaeolus cyanescens TaxID=181874 RepID=A0A409Y6W4_9AGAR|nr:lactose permease [Panaeolus cyanescens]